MLASCVTDTAYLATDLTFGVTYELKIESRNSYGNSGYSETITLLCAFKPDPPLTLSTANTNELVTITWDEPIANGTNRKADELALAINAWLQNMVIACSKSEGFKEYLDIVVLGYGSDDDGNPIIEPALIGPLAGRELVSISDVAAGPARIPVRM